MHNYLKMGPKGSRSKTNDKDKDNGRQPAPVEQLRARRTRPDAAGRDRGGGRQPWRSILTRVKCTVTLTKNQ